MLVLRSVICVVALLTALTYTRYHFWWRIGAGRCRMGLLLAVAMRYGCSAGETFSPRGTVGRLLDDGKITGSVGILLCILCMAYAIIGKNITRMRYPDAANRQARQHLRQTPWATQADIEKLMACWDETHSPGPPRCG